MHIINILCIFLFGAGEARYPRGRLQGCKVPQRSEVAGGRRLRAKQGTPEVGEHAEDGEHVGDRRARDEENR